MRTLVFFATLVAACLTILAPPVVAGPPVTPPAKLSVLYTFSATASDAANSDGGSPLPLVVDSNGSLSVAVADTHGANSDGAGPSSLSLTPDGNLIGTAGAGGAHGAGTVFELTSDGKFTTLHAFSATHGLEDVNSDGAVPLTALTCGSDGRYYGTASSGGSNGDGTIFSIDGHGDFRVLYTFSEISGIINSNPDGAQPLSPLVAANDGNLYGTTSAGGDGGLGTIFRISQTGHFERLYSFSLATNLQSNLDGGHPSGSLALARNGAFCGSATQYGPNSAGTVFQMTPAGEITTLCAFLPVSDKGINPNGAMPAGGLTLGQDGNFYGTTQIGGKHGAGTLFRLRPDGKLTTLYTFSAPKGRHAANSDGFCPQGPLLWASDGNLYGVTKGGGVGGTGTVFRLTPDGVFESLYSFSALDSGGANADGAHPGGPLVEGKQGEIYGTAMDGGAHGTGVVFDFILPRGAAP